MRKLCLLYLGRKGSATIYSLAITRSFIKNAVTIDAFLSSGIENKEDWESLSKDTKMLNCTFINTYRNKLSFLLGSLNVVKFIKLVKQIRRENYDCFYIPMISLWVSIIIMFLDKTKVVTTIHDINPHMGQENIIIDFLKEIAYRNSSKVIVHSSVFIPIVRERYGLPEKKILYTQIGNFLDYTKGYVPEKKIFHKILFFGRIMKYKGLSVLLHALKLLNKKGVFIELRIVGSGELEKEEKLLINELGNQVELINRWIGDNEIQQFFYGIDMTVLPYIEASQSGVTLTSFGFHKPVIVTDVGGLREQVYANTGYCIQPNNPVSLADTIELMYMNPEKILSMGDYAYYMVSEVYTWDKTAKEVLDFIYQ